MRSPQMKHHEAPKQLRWGEDGLSGICEAICWLRCQRNQRQSKFGDVQCFLWRKWFNRCSLKWLHNHRALFFERKKRFPVQYPKLITGKRQPWLNLASPRISPAKLRNWLRFRARRSKQNSLPVNVVDSHLFGPRRRPSKIRWALFVHALLPLRKNPVAHYANAPGPTVSLDRVQM
jgi:hypothetical protein